MSASPSAEKMFLRAPMDLKYTAVPYTEELTDSEPDSEALKDNEWLLSHNPKFLTTARSRRLVVACLVVIIIIQSFFLFHRTSKPTLSLTGLSSERTVERTLYVPNAYTSHNETEANMAWENISMGVGLVAVEEEVVKQNALPESLVWDIHPTKRIYLVEAYHAIHCLRKVRMHYLALVHGRQWDWPIEHDMHCFEGLKEYVMCNPDDELLWTDGNGNTGHGQKKQCHDWEPLREWVYEHTISYHDYERGYEAETKGVYHSGDGLDF